MFKVFTIMFALMLIGCGTASTVGRDNHTVGSALTRGGSYCESMPRMYSGVAYNVCKMNSKPKNFGTIILACTVVDSMFSAVLDTTVLPYTIFSQRKYGNFELREHIR
ncbi:YceK/YidQ family lipoprotein [Microbulbifer okhotskensis]|uniref:YceK/YidQ family lipoprotein n=1 Tax=Microbulbifer okhotskensis TaxID=2926617 RepID=UPI00359C462D